MMKRAILGYLEAEGPSPFARSPTAARPVPTRDEGSARGGRAAVPVLKGGRLGLEDTYVSRTRPSVYSEEQPGSESPFCATIMIIRPTGGRRGDALQLFGLT